MVSEAFYSTLKLALAIISRLIQTFSRSRRKGLQKNISRSSQFSLQRQLSLPHLTSDLSDKTLVFDVDTALLRSPSMFPYFMLVAFEAGSLVRAFLLFVTYPILCFCGEEVALQIMVMVCFLGIKKQSFRAGAAVLPKFFLEDVGEESFEVLRRGGRRVGVTKFPRVMVESFLKDYLGVDVVVGRELKTFGGLYLGLMEEPKSAVHCLTEACRREESPCPNLVGIKSSNKPSDHLWLSHCKEIYVVSDGEKKKRHPLPRDRYVKPLVFHDGRLAFRPTPLLTLLMLAWFPFGLSLSIFRVAVALSLPYDIAIPMLVFTGMRLKMSNSRRSAAGPADGKGLLYVCNHRTLLDPLFLSYGLKRPFTAATYSLSRLSEMLSPIRTVRLMRDRERDARMMEKLLNYGDLVVCPEGTTCREPYLLRFSPLFAELSNDIVPVALDSRVDMYYGTTAGGLKCLDPFFFLMNPTPAYTVRFLDKVRGATTGFSSRISGYDVATQVQRELGKALGFECTSLTRKDKYLVLAGNEGLVSSTHSGRTRVNEAGQKPGATA